MSSITQTAKGAAQKRAKSWVGQHRVAAAILRGLWWLVRHPLLVAGMVLAGWLWSLGLWLPLALTVGSLLPGMRLLLRQSRRVRAPGSGRSGMRDSLARVSNRRKLEKVWPKAAMAAGIEDAKAEDRVPPLQRVRSTQHGMRADLACGKVGVTADYVARRADTLAASIPDCWGVRVTPGRTPGWAHLLFKWSDPLGASLGLDQLPTPGKGQLAFGVTEDGAAAAVKQQKSLLIVGESGSGKSTALWALLASAVAQDVPIRLRVIDPAGGVELSALRNSPLTAEYTDRPKQAADVIKHAKSAMDARLASMSGSTRLHTPTEAEPWDIVVIDELLLMSDLLAKGTASDLGEILSVGRKAAFSVVALTQVSQVDTIGRIRNLFPQKIVLSTENRAMTDATLGDGAEAAGAKCSQIRTPGIGHTAMEGVAGYPRCRVAWVSDDQARIIASGKNPVDADDDDVPLDESTHVMYGWYAADGELLYIGISNDGQRRAMEHVSGKRWAQQPGVSMRIMERFASRDEALEVEKEAIQRMSPRHNIQHAGTVKAGK